MGGWAKKIQLSRSYLSWTKLWSRIIIFKTCHKVQILWEGHKIMKNIQYFSWNYLVTSKQSGSFFFHFFENKYFKRILVIFWHQKDFWPIVWGLCLYYYVAPLWRKFLCLAHPSFVSSYQIFHFMHDFQGLKSFQLLYGLNKQRLGGWMTLFVLSIMTLIIL